jgi:hypothetical protein
MSIESPDPVILEYIRANRGGYSREAIDRELRASGHRQEAIDAAWAALEAEEAPYTRLAAPEAPEADQSFPDYDPASTDPLPAAVESAAPDIGRDPAIALYIRENRGTYTRPAITDALLASGHDRADIDATWAAIAAAEAPPPPSPEVRSRRNAILGSWRLWVTAVLAFIAVVVLPTILTIAIPDQPIGVGMSCVLMIGFVAAGLIMLGIGKARDVAYGLFAGVGALFALAAILALLGFILLVIIFGICLVVLGTSGLNP